MADFEFKAVNRTMLEDIRVIERYCFYPYLYRSTRYFARKILAGNFVAVYIEQTCAGYISLTRHRSFLEISDLAVDIRFRRLHVATAMLEWARRRCIYLHAAKLRLVVDEENECAVKLYTKFGFTFLRSRKNYYGLRNGLVMVLRIR